MASIEHRFNEKKQIDQYRARYRWRDETGKIKNSKTAWFNSIPEGEKESNAINRTKKNIYYCKNEKSVRGIPILDIIYQLLKDYKESYQFESGKWMLCISKRKERR